MSCFIVALHTPQAFPAASLATGLISSIFDGEFMTPRAMRFDFVQSIVVAFRHCAEMVGIAASRMLAGVMNVIAFWNRSDKQFIRKTMNFQALVIAPNTRVPFTGRERVDPAPIISVLEVIKQ